MNRIYEKDTVKAMSFDKDGRLVCSLYDSGFRSVGGVISALLDKGSGWARKISNVSILNEDRGWYGRYSVNGRLIG